MKSNYNVAKKEKKLAKDQYCECIKLWPRSIIAYYVYSRKAIIYCPGTNMVHLPFIDTLLYYFVYFYTLNL